LESFSGCPDVHDFCFCSLFLSDKVVSLPFNSFSLDDDVGPSRQDVVAPGDCPSRRFFLFWRRRPQSLLRRVLRVASFSLAVSRIIFLLAMSHRQSHDWRCSGGPSSHRGSSGGCPLRGCPEIHITGELALLSRLIVVVFCFIIFLTFCFIF